MGQAVSLGMAICLSACLEAPPVEQGGDSGVTPAGPDADPGSVSDGAPDGDVVDATVCDELDQTLFCDGFDDAQMPDIRPSPTRRPSSSASTTRS